MPRYHGAQRGNENKVGAAILDGAACVCWCALTLGPGQREERFRPSLGPPCLEFRFPRPIPRVRRAMGVCRCRYRSSVGKQAPHVDKAERTEIIA